MKIYRYKDSNGVFIKSLYPKPTKEIETTANGIISICVLIIIIIILI